MAESTECRCQERATSSLSGRAPAGRRSRSTQASSAEAPSEAAKSTYRIHTPLKANSVETHCPKNKGLIDVTRPNQVVGRCPRAAEANDNSDVHG